MHRTAVAPISPPLPLMMHLKLSNFKKLSFSPFRGFLDQREKCSEEKSITVSFLDILACVFARKKVLVQHYSFLIVNDAVEMRDALEGKNLGKKRKKGCSSGGKQMDSAMRMSTYRCCSKAQEMLMIFDNNDSNNKTREEVVTSSMGLLSITAPKKKPLLLLF